jgi:hypothetical protein
MTPSFREVGGVERGRSHLRQGQIKLNSKTNDSSDMDEAGVGDKVKQAI